MKRAIETNFECTGLKVVKLELKVNPKNYLLIIPCCEDKILSDISKPAFNCYDGQFYKLLKYYFRNNSRPQNLMIYIVSGKYGLIPEDFPILPYDLKLTEEMAKEINAETIRRATLIQPIPDEIFINLGQEYMPAIKGIEEVFPNAKFVYPKKGDIGFRKHYMKNWLDSIFHSPEFVKYMAGFEINTLNKQITTNYMTEELNMQKGKSNCFIGVGAGSESNFTRNGNKNISLEDVEKWRADNRNTDVYSTCFQYTSENPDAGDIVGNFVMDFDDPEKLEDVKAEVLRVIDYLQKTLNIPYNSIRAYFSGRKGFHLEVPFEVLGVEICADLHTKFKRFALYFKKELNLKYLDTKIYDRKRLIRLPNSKHGKTGLYKIPLKYFELSVNNISEIQELAQNPKAEISVDRVLSYEAKQLFDSVSKIIPYMQAEPSVIKNELCPAMKKILKDGVVEGSRNAVCWKLAAALRKTGCTKEQVDQELRQWAIKCTPAYPQENISNVVDNAFKTDYKIGCNDEVIKPYCDYVESRRSCPYFKPNKIPDSNDPIKIVDIKTQQNKTLKSKPQVALNIEKVIPEGPNFIRQYLDYASPMTDAPIEYHLCGGLANIAMALKRNVFFRLGGQHIYPNVYIAILGDSTLTRKSTALRISSNLMESVNNAILLPNDFSPEALIDTLTTRPQGMFYWYEFATMMDILDRQYMNGAKAMFTELYDCPPRFERILKKQTFLIQDPFISIFTASTLNWFVNRITEGDILGGFLARFIFVPVLYRVELRAFPQHEDIRAKESLVAHLTHVSTISGEMTLSPEARAKYEAWYQTFMEKARNSNSELLGPFYGRLATTFFKIAMCLQIAVNEQLVISLETMDKACNFVDWLADNLNILMLSEVSFSKGEKDRKRIAKMIREHSGITRSKLLQNSNLSAQQLDDALRTLKESEQVTEHPEGRRTLYYAA